MSLIEIGRDVLLQPVKAAVAGLPPRQISNIFGNALLEVDRDALCVTANDSTLQVSARARIEHANGVQAITVSGRKLFDIVKALPADASVGLDWSGTQLWITSPGSRFRLKTIAAVEFSKLAPGADAVVEVPLQQRELKRLFGMTKAVMPEKDVRYWLNGAQLAMREGRLTVAVTDGHRVAWAAAPIEHDTPAAVVIVPHKTVTELFDLLEDSDTPAQVCVGEWQVAFRFGQIELISAVLEGKYPNWAAVIPRNCTRSFWADRLQLLHALQRAAVLPSKMRGVRWLVEDGRLCIESANGENEDVQEVVGVEESGDVVDAGYRIDYLLDAFASIDAERVQCAFSDEDARLLITVPDWNDYEYVVAPMRL